MEHGREAVNVLFEELTQEEVNEIFKRNGLEEGRAEERNRMRRLFRVLKDDNRMDDI